MSMVLTSVVRLSVFYHAMRLCGNGKIRSDLKDARKEPEGPLYRGLSKVVRRFVNF